MEILVAVAVLHVEQRAIVLGPEMSADAALLVCSDYLVVVLADRFYPDLQDVFGVRRQPGQPFAVGGQTGCSPFGISEKNFARDQRWEFRKRQRSDEKTE